MLLEDEVLENLCVDCPTAVIYRSAGWFRQPVQGKA